MGDIDPVIILAKDPQTIYVMCVICNALHAMAAAKAGNDVDVLKILARSKTSSAVRLCRRKLSGVVPVFPTVSYHFAFMIAASADRDLVEALCRPYWLIEMRLFGKIFTNARRLE